jgi:acetaldehyde dehydrogenase/alcohol dehydrogenase
VEKLIEAIKKLNCEVGEPASIKELGINRKDFEKRLEDLATRAANSTCTFMNPRVPDVEDTKKLFLYAYEGKKVNF